MRRLLPWVGIAFVFAVGWALDHYLPDGPGRTGWGTVGNVAIFLGLVAVPYLLCTEHAAATSPHVSPGERQAWLALSIVAVIGLYFAAKVIFLVVAGNFDAGNAHALGRPISVLLIVWGASSWWLRARERGVVEDERDRDIRRRAGSVSHSVLVVVLIAAILFLGFLPADLVPHATPLLIAHALIAALIVASIAEHAVAATLYRRDRQ